jgi:uncharacterized protein (TIGR02147 family)
MENRVVDIYAYQDFRSYLRDFYQERRSKDRKFSIRFFARRAGLRSQNYLKVVMDGRRSLTARNVPKFIKGLGLAGSQAEYFEALVNLNQARDNSEQKICLDRIEHLQKKKTAYNLTGGQLELFSHWYNLAIFEMASQAGFNPDPKEVSRKLQGKITPVEAQDSLDLMVRTGILIKGIDGKLKPIALKIASSDTIAPQYVRRLQESFIKQALEGLQKNPPQDFDVRSLTIALTPEQVPLFKTKIQEFQREMNALFSSGKGSDIYQFNLQFFKLTKND